MTVIKDANICHQRAARARLDEVRVVEQHLLNGSHRNSPVMLDVGAHHGSSLASFAKAGWTVHAFEPDTANRTALESRWGNHRNVRIDSRAVSNDIKHDVPFYTSNESTGISSLSAFQPTHKVAGTVSTTTLATYCEEYSVGHIDFLKIDAEGSLVPHECLPEVRISSEVYAETRGVPGIPDGVPISGIAGDQQSALFGQACFEAGSAKCTYGTGAFILMNTGTERPHSKSGLLSTVAWKLGPDGPGHYALEGSAFIAGAAVQWLRDGLGLFSEASEIEALAAEVPDSGGVVIVPAFAGLGAPHWRPNARGIITGLTRGTTKAHIARAVLEGIALQNFDIVRAMKSDSGHELRSFKVDGGAAANNLLMQFQADILDTEIVRPELLETTALGAAFLAGLGAGVWKDKEELRKVWREDRRFTPSMTGEDRGERLKSWNAAIAKA